MSQTKTVYLVSEEGDIQYGASLDILGVFESQKLAQEFIDMQESDKYYNTSYEITAMTLNDPTADKPYSYPEMSYIE